MEPSSSRVGALAGDGATHPLVLGAAALMAVNDHVLKGWGPGWLTGKVSDFAGLVFAPALLVALIELALALVTRLGRPCGVRAADRRLLIGATAATGLFFAAIQLDERAATLWVWGLGALQWPVYALAAVVRAAPSPELRPVVHTSDPTDLIALPALLIPLLLGWRRRLPPGAPVEPAGSFQTPR